MKSPKNQRPDDEAREATEKFIAKYAGKGVGSAKSGGKAKAAAKKPAAPAKPADPA
jgi:hypothetical protein